MKPLYILKTAIIRPAQTPAWDNDIPKMMRARSPRIWNMAYAAVKSILTDCDRPPKAIVSATALGALDETINYLDGVFFDGFGSPRNFIASVHNSMAGKLAVDFKIRGPNLTVCDGQNSFASAIQTASLLSSDDFPVLLLAVEERIPLLDTLQPHLSAVCQEFLGTDWEEAAVAFLLDQSSHPGHTMISASGPEPIGEKTPQQKCADLLATLATDPATLLPLIETSTSFIKPAIRNWEIVNTSPKGVYGIGSYSPSSSSAACVCLCV